jgi:hypothetical protein
MDFKKKQIEKFWRKVLPLLVFSVFKILSDQELLKVSSK